ncbi:hypothetical protein PUN28_008317 [Cardiocondyla obscurior]|uniref:Uncharacterized protein n=1 Tax=Cardiocondyla obscurior TaxID=286306 RepID=A0AAW2FXH4_9HYME
MVDQDILEIFGDSLSDLSDEEPREPTKPPEPPDQRKDIPRVGSSLQRGDRAQERHTQWLAEPPPSTRPKRRLVVEPVVRRRTHTAMTTAVATWVARATSTPPRCGQPARSRPDAPQPGPSQCGPPPPFPRPAVGPRRPPPQFRPPEPQPWPRPPGPPPQLRPAGPRPQFRTPESPPQLWPRGPPPQIRPARPPPMQQPSPVRKECAGLVMVDPPGLDNPYTRVKLPTGEVITVPISAVWKNRKFRARTSSGKWLLRFDGDGTLRTCRRIDDP